MHLLVELFVKHQPSIESAKTTIMQSFIIAIPTGALGVGTCVRELLL
jgi:hypothetical protein